MEYNLSDNLPTITNKNENLCVRVCRKKYHCIILFIILSISFFQALSIIVEKLNENQVNIILKILNKYMNSTYNDHDNSTNNGNITNNFPDLSEKRL